MPITRKEETVIFVFVVMYSFVHELGHWFMFLILGIPSVIGIIWDPLPAFCVHAYGFNSDITIIEAALISFAGGGFTGLIAIFIYIKYRYRTMAWLVIISLVNGIVEMIFYTTAYVQEISFVLLVNENMVLYLVIIIAPVIAMLIQEFYEYRKD